MLKKLIEQDLKRAVVELGYKWPTDTVLTTSQNPKFGDYSTNVALQLSKQSSLNSHQSSVEIANAILEKIGHPQYVESIEVAGGGFINFFIKDADLAGEVKQIIYEKEFYGKTKERSGKKIQVEFISANPTGPLTLANGRGGAMGDALANVLDLVGYEVETEYYVNDTGNQVRTLGESVQAVLGKVEKKEEHYQGEYIKDLAGQFADKSDVEPQELGHVLADYLLGHEIKPAIKKLNVEFDNFFSERSLYPDKINHALDLLKKSGYTYEKDGALWFRSTEFGDDQDRVLFTSQKTRGRAEPTYYLADVAYHLDVYERGFDTKINLWGADHYGYIKRMEAALEALGYKGRLKVILMQLVKLFKDGKEVRMSKRAGTFVALDELLGEVGVDAARFFFLMYAPSSHIDFNLDLAKEKSNKNPVFYVQYAYARMCSILSKAEAEVIDSEIRYGLLKDSAERALIRHLIEFPSLINFIAKTYEVHKLTEYAIKIADLFHHFYEACPVLFAGNKELVQARLRLVLATKIVLGNTLDILGVSAPEKM